MAKPIPKFIVSSLDESVFNKLLEALYIYFKKGHFAVEVCKKIGMSRRTLDAWMYDARELKAKIEIGLIISSDLTKHQKRILIILRTIDRAQFEWMDHAIDRINEEGEKDINTVKWAMERKSEHWGGRQVVEIEIKQKDVIDLPKEQDPIALAEKMEKLDQRTMVGYEVDPTT